MSLWFYRDCEKFNKASLPKKEISFSSWISVAGRLKNSIVKLDILTAIETLLMVEKGITGGICLSTYWSAKAINKYMKDHDKKKDA